MSSQLAPEEDAPIAAGTSAPVWARRYVAVFLTAFLVCGVFGFEAWPLTGWRLFADARERVQPGWRALAVAPDGTERPLPFRDLDAGYSGSVQVLGRFGDLSPAGQAAVCDAWARAMRERGEPVAAIRVQRTSTDVGDRHGDRAAPPDAVTHWVCRVDRNPVTVERAGPP
jgi:hypothetical protein